MSGYNAVLARNTANAPQNPAASQTVAFSHYNNFSAQLPIDPKTGNLVAGGIKEQAKQCFKNIAAVLESINHVFTDVVRLSIFVTDMRNIDAVDAVYNEYFSAYKPTRTVAAANALPLGALVQVEVIISNGEGTIPNAPQAGDLIKLTNNTTNAPIDALSTQLVAFSHYSHVSTQLPIEPVSGRIVVDGVEAQTSQCLNNIKAVLTSIDVPFDDIVKTTVFIRKLADLDAVNAAYRKFFPDSAIARTVGYYPARTVVVVADLPMGSLVQIEAVVSHGDGTFPQLIEDRHGLIVEPNNTDKAPKCALSTQTVAFSHYNHVSAQLPIDAQTGNLVAGSIKEQVAKCLDNIKAIVESVDHKLEDIVKANVYLKNINDIAALDEVYSAYFKSSVPARRVVGVAELPKGALVQIDVTVANEEGTPPVL